MPFEWKKKIAEPIVEGFVILLALTVLGMIGLAFYFNATLKMPTDLWDFLKLVFACWMVSTLAGFVRGKINL